MAKLLFRNAHIRLTTPEAYPTHRDIIEYNAQYSENRLPDRAVGPFNLRGLTLFGLYVAGVLSATTRELRWSRQC